MKIENLEIEEVTPFINEKYCGLTISWSANIGWGEYQIYTDDGEHWYADTECMDKDEDKDFGKMLLENWMSQIQISG